MFIKTREEALDALSEILALPERRDQIVQVTVKVMMCLTPESRQFLVDSQAGLIEGGLEYMRRKRQEMVDIAPPAPAAAPGEPIIIVDSSTDPLLEAVGSAMDALRLTDVVLQVFPDVKAAFAAWEVARAIVADEASIQEMVRTAVRERKGPKPETFAEMQKLAVEKIKLARPAWAESQSKLKDAVAEVVKGSDASLPAKARDAELLFSVVAVDDQGSALAMELLASNPDEARQYIRDVRDRIVQLVQLEAKHS